MKTIQTVLGRVNADSCGMVLPHEHLFIDLVNQAEAGASRAPITPADRPGLMCDPYTHCDNLRLDDEAAAESELRDLLAAGVDTIVDCSPSAGIGRNPEGLRRLASATGANIVAGCGNYTGDTIPDEVKQLDVQSLADVMIREIENGIGDTGVRPGVIGEIGTSRTILAEELNTLRAAAIVHRATGLAIEVHIYPWLPNGIDAARILMEGGVDPRRIVICHSDVEPDRAYIAELLKLGVWVELDNFGKEFTPSAGGFAAGRFISDAERADLAAEIIRGGFGGQLLLTNDICLKCLLRSRGGAGYAHVIRDMLPMIAARGADMNYLREVVCRENPLAVLAVE